MLKLDERVKVISLLKSKFIWNEQNENQLEPISGDTFSAIKRLFLARGLATEFTSQKDETNLTWHDPFLFKDMDKCKQRINEAIDNNEPILVYGDYDADGVTSTSILVNALMDLGANVDFYIPHRFFDGYGPNEEIFMEYIDRGIKLMITVDCGITSIQEATLLKEHGVDLIIIDHHHPKEQLPSAVGIIHSGLDPNYPFKELAGVGNTLKVVEALRQGNLAPEDYILAAFGTIGDVVPLVDENRTIVIHGLEAIRRTESKGILALLKKIDLSPYEVNESDIGFLICPRLNAPGRMDDASVVVNLLLAREEDVAKKLADEVELANNERKNVTAQIVTEATAIAQSKFSNSVKTLVLYQQDWHEGVLGIVASKLVNIFRIPVIVLTDTEDGDVKGSGRAPEGFDLLSSLEVNKDLLLKFGGHALAAGMSLIQDRIDTLETNLNEYFKDATPIASLAIDLKLSVDEISLDLLPQINLLAPFGQGNKRPTVKLQQVKLLDIKRIGKNHEHLKFTISGNNHKLDAIYFGGAKDLIYLNNTDHYDFVCELSLNEWNGNQSVQARILDLRCNDVQVMDLRNPKIEKEYGTVDLDGFIVDHVPQSLEHLKESFRQSGLKNVVLKKINVITLPNRQEFTFVYKIIKQHAPFQLNENIMNYFLSQNITSSELKFILRVFVELKLVTYVNGTLLLLETSEKVDFTKSTVFNDRKKRVEISEFFEYATRQQILDYLLK